MKKFIGKTQEEALNNAAAELNVPVENIYIESVEEIKKGLFGLVKNIEVTCYTDAMIVEFVQDYLKNIIELMGIEVTITPNYSDGLIKLKISLIGMQSSSASFALPFSRIVFATFCIAGNPLLVS